MIGELIPWRTLTRDGVPALKVALRPLVVGEVTVGVGETFNAELFPEKIRAERLRQFYEMRRLEPLGGTKTLRQHYLETLAKKQAQALAETVEPVMPVASRIVAAVADMPALEVPVESAPTPRPRPKPKRRR